MPGYAYGIPAKNCQMGSILHAISGSVCKDCYALKGRYRFKNVQNAQEKRLASLTHPQWVEAMVYMIRHKNSPWFRWHDSGDIQDINHLKNIIAIAEELPNVNFWLPTRERRLVKFYLDNYWPFPENLVVRVSGTMVDGPRPKGFPQTSTVVTEFVESNCYAITNNNECGACRDCWNPHVANVAYLKH